MDDLVDGVVQVITKDGGSEKRGDKGEGKKTAHTQEL
jgi:hypothetical protein